MLKEEELKSKVFVLSWPIIPTAPLQPLIYLSRAGGGRWRDLGGLQVGRPKFANGEGFSHKKCFKSI